MHTHMCNGMGSELEPRVACMHALKNDCFGRVVLCCFAFLLCCCCCLAFLSISRIDCSCIPAQVYSGTGTEAIV